MLFLQFSGSELKKNKFENNKQNQCYLMCVFWIVDSN